MHGHSACATDCCKYIRVNMAVHWRNASRIEQCFVRQMLRCELKRFPLPRLSIYPLARPAPESQAVANDYGAYLGFKGFLTSLLCGPCMYVPYDYMDCLGIATGTGQTELSTIVSAYYAFCFQEARIELLSLKRIRQRSLNLWNPEGPDTLLFRN